jgi:Plants and Prokaryotes Conserved (PCC) domain
VPKQRAAISLRINVLMASRGSHFQKQLGRIEELINALNTAPDSPLCAQARELLQMLLQLHGNGFGRALELIHDSTVSGQLLVDRPAKDPLIYRLSTTDGQRPKNIRMLHAHVVVGKADGTVYGGHFLRGRVWPTLEMIVSEMSVHLRRNYDEETGLVLIDLSAS